MKPAILMIGALIFAIPAHAQACDDAKLAELKAIGEALQSRNDPNIAATLGRWNSLLGECLRAPKPPAQANTVWSDMAKNELAQAQSQQNSYKGSNMDESKPEAVDIGAAIISRAAR